MTKESILMLDDDLTFCQSLRERMRINYVEVIYTASPAEILEKNMDFQYCLVMINTSLKRAEGLVLLQMIRSSTRLPILALDRDVSIERRAALLKSGANACLEKPVDLDVCVAQAQSLIQLHKGNFENCHLLKFGRELLISLHHRQVLVDGNPVQLTRKEFDLLHCLASSPGQVFSLEQLYLHVWDEVNSIGGDETVKVHIKTLRKKLTSLGKNYIQNVRGIGYKFVLENR